MLQRAENPSTGPRGVVGGSRGYADRVPPAREIDPVRAAIWGGLLLLIPLTWALIIAGLLTVFGL